MTTEGHWEEVSPANRIPKLGMPQEWEAPGAQKWELNAPWNQSAGLTSSTEQLLTPFSILDPHLHPARPADGKYIPWRNRNRLRDTSTAASSREMAVAAHLHMKQQDAWLLSHLPSKCSSPIYIPLTKDYSPLMERPREQTSMELHLGTCWRKVNS